MIRSKPFSDTTVPASVSAFSKISPTVYFWGPESGPVNVTVSPSFQLFRLAAAADTATWSADRSVVPDVVPRSTAFDSAARSAPITIDPPDSPSSWPKPNLIGEASFTPGNLAICSP